jgi:uncharacterized protein (DUF305 family)
METKSLLYGLIGFFIGGLLVSVAATTFDKPTGNQNTDASMSQMTSSLQDKQGEDFDKAFIENMIMHHEGAVEMAKMSAKNAKHEEIKLLSDEIITAQKIEITQMQQWQKDWGYTTDAVHKKMTH